MTMKAYILYACIACGLMTVVACRKNDHNFRDIIRNGEINYTGKVDSVKSFPGINRIKFTYLLKSDPKITRVVIYWNNFADSVVQPIVRSPKVDTITTVVNNISEGSHTFSFITYDNNGNYSIRENVAATVYGSNYIFLLGNRPRVTSELSEAGGAMISWFIADPLVIGTEIVYTDTNDEEQTIIAPSWQLETILPGYKPGTSYQLTTLYQPESNMMDTLRAATVTVPLDHEEVTSIYLKNPGGPFLYSTWDGVRYGKLKDWTVTSAAQIENKPGGFGSFDNVENSGSMTISRLGSEPAITNGRIYQSMSLPAGTYRFIVYFNDTVAVSPVQLPFNTGGATGARVVVAAGTALPAATPTAANTLGFTTLNEKSTAVFTLTQTKQVAMGMWATYSAAVEAYFRASKVKLIRQID